MAHIRGDKEN